MTTNIVEFSSTELSTEVQDQFLAQVKELIAPLEKEKSELEDEAVKLRARKAIIRDYISYLEDCIEEIQPVRFTTLETFVEWKQKSGEAMYGEKYKYNGMFDWS